MRRLPLFLLVICALVLPSAISRGQQVLSFQPGGREACSSALHRPLPGPADDPRGFAEACAVRDLAIEKTQFDALAHTMDSRSPEERVAFNVLLVSFISFRDQAVKMPLCAPGAGCGLSADGLKAQANGEFLRLASGAVQFPDGSDFPAADADLNSSYEKALTSLPVSCTGPSSQHAARCISQDQLRDTQRDWIRYRHAFLTFVKVRWPEAAPEAWLAYLTQLRSQQLKMAFPA
jgi:uncharacterized protein YecT (DUF1311 family)